MNFIDVKNLNKQIESNHVLNDINFNIPEGEILGVIGHNGAGKTTLFKTLLGLTSYNTGNVAYFNSDFDLKNDVGYLPEQRGLFAKEKVGNQLKMLGCLKNMSLDQLDQQIDHWLQFFDIYEHKEKKILELSKGNQQKVQFISSVIHNPQFLILDEPFSGLDPINREYFTEAILKMKERGSTIIYSSHQLDYVEELSDKILFLKKGKTVHFNTLEEIKAYYPPVLKVKNSQLTSEKIEKTGLSFVYKKGIFEIIIAKEKDLQVASALANREESEIQQLEQPSLEKIFTEINLKGSDE